ncbi:SP_1767 family glycosyltransferase [Streptococcus cameli]
MSYFPTITVKPILESLDYILKNQSSVARFGDGEIDIITGHSIPYQTYQPELGKRLKEILQTKSSPEFLVCLPDVFERRQRYNSNANFFWETHMKQYRTFYEATCTSPWYGSTFLSRPYIDLEDKTPAKESFERLTALWNQRDLLIIEGETSRSGVGNDLFQNAKSISRIICPSKDAFAHYTEIYETAKQYAEDKLVLIMLGPTAKLLAYDLHQDGFQAIDLGHIDSEYEWFKMKATHKVKLNHKHTAEFNRDTDIAPVEDEEYFSQIIARVGIQNEEPFMAQETVKIENEIISIIIPVYNVKQYLKRCLDSILKQTYSNLEIILVNDGSTDGSAIICNEYAAKDKRIRVIHQSNSGVSQARNNAIKQATGRYITFIDSDDFIEEHYLEALHTSLVKNKTDIAVCNFASFNEERQSFLFFTRSEDYFEKVYNTQEWLDQEGVARYNMYLVFTFSPLKLFKRELFDGIEYPVNRVREDDATIYKLYLKAKTISFINSPGYYYSQRQDSLSRTVMQADITTMISNAEERIALLASLGYDLSTHITSYVNRLKKCQADALYAGQIELYNTISAKLDLYNNYKKK